MQCTHQYSFVNGDSAGNVQYPVNWLIGDEYQNEWLWAVSTNWQMDTSVPRVVHPKPMVAIAFIVADHMHIVLGIVNGNTAVCGLRLALKVWRSHCIVCISCDVAASHSCCWRMLILVRYSLWDYNISNIEYVDIWRLISAQTCTLCFDRSEYWGHYRE